MDAEVRGGVLRSLSPWPIRKRAMVVLTLAASLIGAALAVPTLGLQHTKAASSIVVFRAIDHSAGAAFDQLSEDGNVDTTVSVRVSDTAYRAKTDSEPIQYVVIDVSQQDLTTGKFLKQISGVATNPDVGMGGTVAVHVDNNLRNATVTALVMGYDMIHQREGVPIAVSLTWTANSQAANVSQEYRLQTPHYIDIEHLRGKGYDATLSNVSITVEGVDYSTVPLQFAQIFKESDSYTFVQHL